MAGTQVSREMQLRKRQLELLGRDVDCSLRAEDAHDAGDLEAFERLQAESRREFLRGQALGMDAKRARTARLAAEARTARTCRAAAPVRRIRRHVRARAVRRARAQARRGPPREDDPEPSGVADRLRRLLARLTGGRR